MWEKNCIPGQTTDDNMAYEFCILDNYGYKHSEHVIPVDFPRQ